MAVSTQDAPEISGNIRPVSLTGRFDRGRRPWPSALAIFSLCSILLVLAFRTEISGAIEVWSDSQTFGHDFFILPITLFIFYRQRHQLSALQPKAAPLAIIPIAILSLVWLAGDLANLLVVKQFAFVALWQSLFLLVFGWQVARSALFPLAYLYLAVPVGVSLIPMLQDVTGQIVVRLLRVTGIPVFMDGYYFEIPGGSFVIAEACSGVRYLIVSIALGILAAYLFLRSWRRRAIFVGLSVVVPIIANGLRAYGIIMIAYLSDYELAVSIDHVIYGFIFLSAVTLSLFGIGILLRRGDQTLALEATPSDATGIAFNHPQTATRNARLVLWAGLSMAVVLLTQTWAAAAKAPPAEVVADLRGPILGPSWQVESNTEPIWQPEFQGTDATLQQSFRRIDNRVDLYIAYFGYQREGAEAISDINRVPGSHSLWKVISSDMTQVAVGSTSLPVNSRVIRRSGQTVLIWYWYRVANRNTNSQFEGKLLEMAATATGDDRAAAIIAVGAVVSENLDETATLLRSFLEEGLDRNGALFQVDNLPRAVIGEPERSPG